MSSAPISLSTRRWVSRKRAAGSGTRFPERGELFGLKFLRERVRELEQISIHDLIDLVERQVDAVVGDAPLREVEGADPFASIAAADERLARCGFLALPLHALLVEQARGEHRHRLRAIAVLRAVVLALVHDPGWQMSDANRGIGLVHRLAAGA